MEVSKGTMPSISNAREGDMSAEELAQCLLDITSWLSENAGEPGKEYAAKPPPSPSDLASLADFLAPTPLPPSLAELLRLHDGGILLFEFTGLSVAEITQAVTDGRKEDKWAAGIVPVARNPDGELLVMDEEGLRTWTPADGKGSLDAPSLSAYLEQYSKRMLGGKLEYMEDCGIMEVA
mmetsp:Transcript_1691/g.3829  ORF Transcript_1691/g.3829 Transcript_1691/m.3829 type:complete len:179 (+) Transcript_1691:45-581(+)